MDIYEDAANIGREAARALITLMARVNNQEDEDAVSDGFWDELIGTLNETAEAEELTNKVCQCN